MATQGYCFKIEEKDGQYVFRLYPNNSRKQSIGESAEMYPNIALCRNALEGFRKMVNMSEPGDLLFIEKKSDTEYLPYLKKEVALFRRTIAYTHKSQSSAEWTSKIWNNIDAPLK